MREIKIAFIGFWPGFQPEDNCFTNILRKHYQIIISDKPDYIFCSCFSNDYLQYEGIRIYYTGECLVPDFNLFDYAIGYDYMEYGDRYLRLPNYFLNEYRQDVELMLSKHLNYIDLMNQKTEFCSFVVSKGDSYVDVRREQFFYLLSRYKKVNSGGRFLNNIGEPQGIQDKLAFQRKHKFAIAFENTSHPGYSTEKIVQAFAAGTVPIYWGDPEIDGIFNPNAFVNCHRFTSFDEVVKKIEQIDMDDQLYQDMLCTPALTDQCLIDETRSRLEEFLVYIFDNEYEAAFRRDRIGYGKLYSNDLKNRNSRRRKWFIR